MRIKEEKRIMMIKDRLIVVGSLIILVGGTLVDAYIAASPPLFVASINARLDETPSAVFFSSNGSEHSGETPYRSIGEVVGGLHGGKYQFGGGSPGGSDYVLSGPLEADTARNENVQDEELPKWALRMKPRDDSMNVLKVPSNAKRVNGMIQSAFVTITNDERTWERFHAKIVSSDGSTDNNSMFVVTPSSGDLAPRGGASNACDASQPYSDSVTLRVIHNEKVMDSGMEYWLVAGTEEEQWSYQLRLSS